MTSFRSIVCNLLEFANEPHSFAQSIENRANAHVDSRAFAIERSVNAKPQSRSASTTRANAGWVSETQLQHILRKAFAWKDGKVERRRMLQMRQNWKNRCEITRICREWWNRRRYGWNHERVEWLWKRTERICLKTWVFLLMKQSIKGKLRPKHWTWIRKLVRTIRLVLQGRKCW